MEVVRAAAADALGDERLDGIAADASLVREGVISSLEIVAVTTALEERFGLRIPAAQVTVQNFDSLRAMARLVQSQGVDPGRIDAPEGEEWAALRASAAAAIRRPVLLLSLTLAFLGLLDLGLRALMVGPLADSHHSFLERGHRLYPVGGTYSQDDLAFAISQHRIVRQSMRRDFRVAVFGDSGTIGSFVPHEDAIPGALQKALRARYPEAEVFNLAFFMQFFAKDLMIMEAVIEQSGGELPFEVAVFTLGDDYFSRDFVNQLQSAMPYLSLNWDLLDRFAKRIPENKRPPFESLTRDLRSVSGAARTTVEGWMQRNSAIFHYAPYFRYLVTEVLRSAHPFDYAYSVGRRPLLDPVPDEPPKKYSLSLGVAPPNLDRRVVAMADATIEFLRERGIKIVLYLKPHGPNEWRGRYQQGQGTSAREIAEDLCRGDRCVVVDLRWSLSGRQFTDTLAHYGAEANRQIAEQIAGAITREVLR